MNHALQCWCGNTDLIVFSPEYLKCQACETLVTSQTPAQAVPQVTDDERDFYGRQYWFAHQEQDLGFTNVTLRARADLPERGLHWLRTVLKYKLPPGRVLELGSAHGGFVALLRWAGFEATGLELSPWVVDFGRRTFDVPMLLGPVEDQSIERGSLDVIALMDVLEHLPNPVGTMRHCLNLLKPDGVLVIQTPRYPEGKNYDAMVAESDPFLEQLKANEHLYLFSPSSIRELFHRLGADQLAFEPAIFAQYDMFLVVSQRLLATHSTGEIEKALSGTPGGRLVQAFLDVDTQRQKVAQRLDEAEADRKARLVVIEEQGRQMGEVEAERNNLRYELADLRQQFESAERDRAARLAVMEEQEEQIRVTLAQLRALQRSFSAIQRSRVYRLLRRWGRWGWVEDAISQSAARLSAYPEPASAQPVARLSTSSPSHTFCASSAPEKAAVPRVLSLEDYISTIQAFNETRPDLDGVRTYNHEMIDVLAQLRPIAGKQLLDVGASPHGYALEWAMQKRVSTYIGIGLGVCEPLEVQHHGHVGKLINMNAEAMEFEPATFDLILSISTFEHFSNGAQVLREMYRVLKRGGSALFSFQPVWTCSRGHHLHHIPAVAKLIPPWGHLLWDAEAMYRACQGHWPADAPMSLEKVIEWIYKGDEINRMDIVTLQDMFYRSEFQIEWITPLLDDESNDKPLIANYLSKILPHSARDLMTLGFSLLLNKP